MAFTTREGMVRIDLFKERGGWYATGAVCMTGYYSDTHIHDALERACDDEFNRGKDGEWPVRSSRQQWLNQGGFIVCLEPYHEHSHPITLMKPIRRS